MGMLTLVACAQFDTGFAFVLDSAKVSPGAAAIRVRDAGRRKRYRERGFRPRLSRVQQSVGW